MDNFTFKIFLEVVLRRFVLPAAQSNTPGLPKVRRLQTIGGQSPDNNMKSLQAKIMEVLGSLHRDTLAKASRRFRQRIEAIVEVVGDFFK